MPDEAVQPALDGLAGGAFQRTALDIAGTGHERTLILQMFVYVGLLFTLLTIPFLHLLERELERRDITIRLGGAEP